MIDPTSLINTPISDAPLASYIALARSLRPKTFQAVVGQEVTLQALTNALNTGRLHHAYLFAGTRGVGKTTLARIFAKCLNCERGISATPCGTCDTCLSIDEGRCVDVLEVDAASRTKVEDTRELLENVQYLPGAARFKIYLIDEVHMLSSHSFNALLKTLEEPPPHVKFLFATTDPQKLPVTVLSRCLQFHLHRLPFVQIVDYLKQVLTRDNILFELPALEEISRSSEGSLRDALSLLEQAIAYCHGSLTSVGVRKMLGLTETAHLLNLLRGIIARSATEILKEISTMANDAPDFASVLSDFLVMLRHLTILQEAPDALEESVSERPALQNLAQQLSAEEIQLYYQIGVMGQKELPYAPTPRIGFEMIMLRMMAFQPCTMVFPQSTNQAVENPAVENQPKSASAQVGESRPTEIKIKENENVAVKTENVAVKTGGVALKTENVALKTGGVALMPEQARAALTSENNTLEWSTLIQKLELSGITRQLAEHCTVAIHTDDFIHLILEETQKPLLQSRQEEKLKQAVTAHFGRAIRLKITVGKMPEGTKTPAKHYQQQQESSYKAACHIVEGDPQLNDLIKTFDAKIEKIEIEND